MLLPTMLINNIQLNLQKYFTYFEVWLQPCASQKWLIILHKQSLSHLIQQNYYTCLSKKLRYNSYFKTFTTLIYIEKYIFKVGAVCGLKKLKPGYAAGYHGKSDPGAGIKGMIDKGDTKQFATRKKIGSMRSL